MAKKFGISREMADAYSAQSHVKAAAAIDGGLFKDEIIPVEVEEVFVANDKRQTKKSIIDTDEGVRRDTTTEGLSKLRPAFGSIRPTA